MLLEWARTTAEERETMLVEAPCADEEQNTTEAAFMHQSVQAIFDIIVTLDLFCSRAKED